MLRRDALKFGIAAKLALLLALVGVLAAGATGFYSYAASREILIQLAKNDLANSASALFRRIRLSREEVSRNLLIVSTHPLAVEASQSGQAAALDQLAELFSLMMAANPAYLQLRLIALDNGGPERVRIDRDGDRLVRVGRDQLQMKGDLPYVRAASRLPHGTTYISRFAINHEPGIHSGLGKPTAQLAMPVVDSQRRVVGVVVINVDLDATFGLLSADIPSDYQLFLANSEGDFLMHPDPGRAFAFDRGPAARLQDEFPATRKLTEARAEQELIEAGTGRYADAPLVAAFLSRPIAVASAEERLVIGLAVPKARVLAQAEQLGRTTLKIVLGLYLVCILLAVLVARAVTRPINLMSVLVRRFAEGHQSDRLHTDRQDEIGVLARSFYNMQNQINFQMDELRQSRQELEHLARHDLLTGLPNRRLFDEHMEQALSTSRREIEQLALMFIDIDHFKPINDLLGHAIGDLLLKEIAGRIRMAVRESDIPARIGGDEFVVLLQNVQQRQDALTVAEKIRTAIMQSFEVEGHRLSVSASIGIALYPDDGNELLELSVRADKAMYVAKEQGRNAVVFYHRNFGEI